MSNGKRIKQQIKNILLQKTGLCLLLFLAAIVECHAQQDSTAVDTVVISDTATVFTQSETDQTPEYDTAQNYFNLKNDIDEPYSQRKIQSRVQADKEVNDLKDQDDFWYIKSVEKFKSKPEIVTYDKAQQDSLSNKEKAKANSQQFSEEETETIRFPPWVDVVVWGIIIGIFLFAVVYFLLANKINIFSRSAKNKGGTESINEVDDLFAIPYKDLLQKAYSEKNYRFAVRILYLQTLKLLSEKNIITFQSDYTNLDYLQQLSPTLFYKDFFAITRHYEYVWYGGFGVSESAFGIIQNDFNTIQNKILHR